MDDPVPLILRPAGPMDAVPMRRLAAAAYEKYVDRIGREPAPVSADYERIAESGDAWVAEQGGRLVGLLVVAAARDHLLIENVAVAPQAQGLGIGRELLRLAEEQARAHGLHDVRLYTNEAMTENLEFYPRRGFRETGRAVQDGFHRVFFAKPVSAEPTPRRDDTAPR